ncbi:MAG: DnaJ family domain-containing protein [Candidatus Promineifilaceae bacterium]|jgi:DnaJ family protein C protein 28
MSKKGSKNEGDDIDRETWTEADRQAEHKIRMRFEYKDLIDDLIQEGQQRGLFDNLAGAGKPLDLKSDLYSNDSKLANDLMKEHNVLPQWLARRNTVSLVIEELRDKIGRHWQRHEQAYRLTQDDTRRKALSLSWRAQCRAWEEEIKGINKQIDEYNLRRPGQGMEMFKLRLDEELKRAGASRELNNQ